eukprot:scaffold133016_cov18-Tisochrysis_lutea.AAC.1
MLRVSSERRCSGQREHCVGALRPGSLVSIEGLEWLESLQRLGRCQPSSVTGVLEGTWARMGRWSALALQSFFSRRSSLRAPSTRSTAERQRGRGETKR